MSSQNVVKISFLPSEGVRKKEFHQFALIIMSSKLQEPRVFLCHHAQCWTCMFFNTRLHHCRPAIYGLLCSKHALPVIATMHYSHHRCRNQIALGGGLDVARLKVKLIAHEVKLLTTHLPDFKVMHTC